MGGLRLGWLGGAGSRGGLARPSWQSGQGRLGRLGKLCKLRGREGRGEDHGALECLITRGLAEEAKVTGMADPVTVAVAQIRMDEDDNWRPGRSI